MVLECVVSNVPGRIRGIKHWGIARIDASVM